MSRRDSAWMPLRRAASDPWLLRDDAEVLWQQAVQGCCLFTAVVFLYTMSSKEEFDEKLIDCVRSFPVIYDLSKKSYKDKISKDNAWKRIATYLERDGKCSV